MIILSSIPTPSPPGREVPATRSSEAKFSGGRLGLRVGSKSESVTRAVYGKSRSTRNLKGPGASKLSSSSRVAAPPDSPSRTVEPRRVGGLRSRRVTGTGWTLQPAPARRRPLRRLGEVPPSRVRRAGAAPGNLAQPGSGKPTVAAAESGSGFKLLVVRRESPPAA